MEGLSHSLCLVILIKACQIDVWVFGFESSDLAIESLLLKGVAEWLTIGSITIHQVFVILDQ